MGEIQRLTSIDSWRHVASANNPADLQSKGVEPNVLSESSMWWHGPAFLAMPEDQWPVGSFERLVDIPEYKGLSAVVTMAKSSIINDLISKYSDLNKACRILAYCLTFVKKGPSETRTVFVSHVESFLALHVMCKNV